MDQDDMARHGIAAVNRDEIRDERIDPRKAGRPDDVLPRHEIRRRWGGLSPAAQAFGRMWDVSRADTIPDLVELFRADPLRVEDAADEFFAHFPEFVDNPPPHGQATP
jgi:hypothetical protein